MNKEKILNWVGGLWFAINLPVIPFLGSLVYGLAAENFLNGKMAFVIITLIVFFIILFLSKIWVGKFIKIPVILSLLPFLYATLQLAVVRDFLTGHRPILFWIILIVLVVVVCTVVVKGMRGELNKDL